MFASIRRFLSRGQRGARTMSTAAAAAERFSSAPDIPGFECVTLLSDIARAEKGLVAAALPSSGTPIVLVHHKGSLSALYGLCPHKDADMSLGDIEDSHTGTCVKCPRHRKKFNGGLNFRVEDGSSWVNQPCVGKYDPAWNLPVFAVQTVENYVYVSSTPVKGVIPPRRPADDAEDDAKDGKKEISASASAVKLDATATPVVAPHNPAPIRDCFITASVSEIIPHTRDTYIYRVRVDKPPKPAQEYPMWHLSIMIEGDATTPSISREYTPISTLQEWNEGRVDFAIKLYPGGRFSSRLKAITPGSRVMLSIPEPTLVLPSFSPPTSSTSGSVSATVTAAEGASYDSNKLLLIAGGSGITPMLQIMKWLIGKPEYEAVVLYSNHGLADVLLEDLLNSLCAELGSRCRVIHTLSRESTITEVSASPHASFETGRIRSELLAKNVAGCRFRKVIVSGPRGMFESVVTALVDASILTAAEVVDTVVELEA